jgi:5'-3' exonuclease
VPGIPGVAFKTAAKLLATYGTLENVILQAAEVTGKLGENLRNSLGVVRLARQLVAFKTDMALGLTWKALRYVHTAP